MPKNSVKPQDLKSLCQKYLSYYKAERLSVSLSEINNLAKRAVEEAEKTHKKLTEPKICDLATYTTYWVREVILKDLNKRTIKRVALSGFETTDDYFTKAVARYFSVLPLEKLQELHRKFLTTFPYKKRETFWRNSKELFKQLEKQFVKLTIARNRLAHNKGYARYTDMILANSQIPKSGYRNFNKNIDAVIAHYHQQLPKLSGLPNWFYRRFNLPCFICRIPFPNLAIPEDVINLVEKEYPILRQFRHKIHVRFGDHVWTKYYKEKDSFKIILQKKNNDRHKTFGLIHELGHVIVMLENFKKKKDPLAIDRYFTERSAIEKELVILKTLPSEILRARLADVLMLFHRVLFELALYKSPKQDLPKLYAKIFNRCFLDANQKDNPLYLLDEYIVARSLSSLPQVVAYAELLFNKYKFINKNQKGR